MTEERFEKRAPFRHTRDDSDDSQEQHAQEQNADSQPQQDERADSSKNDEE